MHQNAFGGRETEGERGRGGEKGGGDNYYDDNNRQKNDLGVFTRVAT